MSTENLRRIAVAVVGAGRIGRMHAENLVYHLPEARLAAIVDPAVDRAWFSRLGVEACFDDVETVLEDPAIEALVVAAPSDLHVDLVERAAAAGKHVFCEKPIAFDRKAVARVIERVEAAGVLLQVGFNRRFDASFSRARETVRSGALGELYTVAVTSRDSAPPSLEFVARSGGIFLDMMIHDMDTVRSLTGSEIEEVHTRAAVLVDPRIGELGDVDTVIVGLRLESGALGTILVSRQSAYGYDQRLEVLGAEGSVRVDNLWPTATTYTTAEGVRSDPLHPSFAERFHAAFVTELRAFLRCVREGRAVPVGARDALAALSAARAAQLSHELGRSVRLDELDGLEAAAASTTSSAQERSE